MIKDKFRRGRIDNLFFRKGNVSKRNYYNSKLISSTVGETGEYFQR
jgi:hypothetical protein